MAVLLGRPHTPKVETINDKDALLSNFWRALKADPEGIIEWSEWPVLENDLHARHKWLVEQLSWLKEKMESDPDFYDVKIAGWWLWGINIWIGSGWCSKRKSLSKQIPSLSGSSSSIISPPRSRPQLSGNTNKLSSIYRKRPQLTGAGTGIHSISNRDEDTITNFMYALSERIRNIRVCCGDWLRVLGPTPTYLTHGLTGVFLDPPYPKEERHEGLYSEDSDDLPWLVKDWALENGDNPLMRIALCGYEGTYEMPSSWKEVAWIASAGLSAQNLDRDNQNRYRERIWFSPHCLKTEQLKFL